MDELEQEFTIKCKMRKRWVPHFYAMLKQMERYGSLGCSRNLSFYSDGDGDFRPKFDIDIDVEEAEPRHNVDGACFYDAG